MCNYCEPDYLTNIHEIVAEEVENRLSEETRQIRTDNRAANECIKELRSSNEKLQHDIKALQEKTKDEITHALRHSWVGFDVWDYVFIIVGKRISNSCEECNGTRKVEMEYRGEKIQTQCPKCNGNGIIWSDKKYIIVEGYIKQIDTSNWSGQKGKINRQLRNLYLSKDQFSSSDSYSPEDGKLYRTKEEAQQERTKLETGNQ